MRSGFTLVEVVAVLAILGLGLGVAAPAYLALSDGDEMSVAAAEVADVLRMSARAARERAMPITVVLDSTAARYWVVFSDTVMAGNFATSGIRLGIPAARIGVTFQPDGRATSANLFIHGPSGTRCIEIDGWTGDIDVRH